MGEFWVFYYMFGLIYVGIVWQCLPPRTQDQPLYAYVGAYLIVGGVTLLVWPLVGLKSVLESNKEKR